MLELAHKSRHRVSMMKWIFPRIPRRGQTGQPRGETATILAELLRGGRGRGRDDDIHGSVVGRHGSHRHLHRCLLAVRDALGGRHQDGRRVFLARSVGPRHRLLHNRSSGGGGGFRARHRSSGAGNHMWKLKSSAKCFSTRCKKI